jgi:hypothetical protein
MDAAGREPQERCAFVDVVDPGGHDIGRFRRFIATEKDVEAWSWVALSPGPAAATAAAVWADHGWAQLMKWTVPPTVQVETWRFADDDEWQWRGIRFTCKACKDAGRPAVSTIDRTVIDEAFDGLLPRCRETGTPAVMHVRATAVAALD